jgi:hypothetical protein
MLTGQRLHLRACVIAAVDQAKQSMGLVEREPQVAAPADEAEALAEVVSIEPMPALAARRRR